MGSDARIRITGEATSRTLIRDLAGLGLLQGKNERVEIQLGDDAFLHCSAIAFLCAWGLEQKRAGTSFTFSGASERLRYLSRMNVHSLLGAPEERMQRFSEAGRFLPVLTVTDEQSVATISNALCDLILCQFDDAASFLPAAEWAVNEIIDNILVHAQSSVPGCVCAQYFPYKKRLEVSVVDRGRGIKNSLGQRFGATSHYEAIQLALTRGVTRDPSVGQGNGMAGAKEIAHRNTGGLVVWTGDAAYEMWMGAERTPTALPDDVGTGVAFSLDTTKPVDLASTWIASAAGWSYIDAEAMRLAEGGGLRVVDACVHTNGRPPATPLRRKLVALCSSAERPLVLDFAGVKSASSSFLDELLGKLAVDLGPEGFKQKVRLTGMLPAVHSMANVVLSQRLKGSTNPFEGPDGGRRT